MKRDDNVTDRSSCGDSRVSTNDSLIQMSIRPYVTCHSKFRSSDKISTTPKSSKVHNKSRLVLVRQHSMRALDKKTSHHKYKAETFTTNQKSQQSDPSNKESSNNNTESIPCKRRRNALIFEQDNDKEVPPSARSLHRAQSLSVIKISPLSPDYIDHYSLQTVAKPRSASHCAFGSISGETLCQLLLSLTTEQFCQKFFLVDCRYPFEYNGGHIKNAVNIYDLTEIQLIFYPDDEEKFKEINSKIPIFYCEYSQKRGPSMALELRRQDRMRNEHNYPQIDYKEIYVLDEGYQNFFAKKRYVDYCEPNGYITMFHSKYAEERKRYHFHLHDHTQAKLRCRHDLLSDSTNTSEDMSFSSTFSSIRDYRRSFQRYSKSFSFTSETETTNNSSLISNDLENDNSNNTDNKERVNH